MNVTITILAAILWTQQFSRLASQTNLRPAFSESPPMTGFRQRTGFSMPTVLVKCGDFDPIPLCSISTWKNRCGAEPLHQLRLHYTPAFLQMQQEFCTASGCQSPSFDPHVFPHTQKAGALRSGFWRITFSAASLPGYRFRWPVPSGGPPGGEHPGPWPGRSGPSWLFRSRPPAPDSSLSQGSP